MKKILLLAFLFISIAASAQIKGYLPYDTVYAKLTGHNTELVLENGTKSVKGFLFNTGNGRTIFKKAVIAITDTTFQIGLDTLTIPRPDLSNYGYSVTLSPGTSTYSLPAGKLLEKVEITEASTISVDIGTSIGGSQIAAGVPVNTGHALFSFNYRTTTTQNIYFSNLTGSSVLKLYIK